VNWGGGKTGPLVHMSILARSARGFPADALEDSNITEADRFAGSVSLQAACSEIGSSWCLQFVI
jgi:hypothetical protein